MDVKQIALQVVNALPDGLGFDELAEFLYERELVEQGRDDFVTGNIRSNAAVEREATECVPK